MDVHDAIKKLYGNIPVMLAYNAGWSKLPQVVVLNNYVSTNYNIYRQMVGSIMGTQVAPSFSNLCVRYQFRHVFCDDAVLHHSPYIYRGVVVVF